MENPESPVFGYREFEVTVKHGQHLLRGFFGQIWRTAELEAKCFCGPPPGRDAPIADPKHRCGIYLRREKPIITPYVSALCVGWGKVVEHELGWRVQHCRIERLVLSPPVYLDIADILEQHYGVPVERVPGPVVTVRRKGGK
jgi:hypothetical protein